MAYDPNQPRDPEGSATGGEWTSDGSVAGSAARQAAGLLGPKKTFVSDSQNREGFGSRGVEYTYQQDLGKDSLLFNGEKQKVYKVSYGDEVIGKVGNYTADSDTMAAGLRYAVARKSVVRWSAELNAGYHRRLERLGGAVMSGSATYMGMGSMKEALQWIADNHKQVLNK